MIKQIIQNHKRKKIFYALIGYRKIIHQRKFKNVRDIINKIHQIEISSIKFNPIFMYKINNMKNEIVLRQYLIQNLRNKLFFNYLIKLGGGNNYLFTAPKEWLSQLESDGKNTNIVGLYIYAFNRMIKSFIIFFSIIHKNIFVNDQHKLNKQTSCFFNLVEGCLPENSKNKYNNIINWYLNWNNKLKNLNVISSNVKTKDNLQINDVKFVTNKTPEILIVSKLTLVKLFFVYILDLLISLCFMILGNVGNAIMLPELLLYRLISFAKSKDIAGHYMFIYTFSIYRPIWSYVAEKKGAKITLYFNSVNAVMKSPFGKNNQSLHYYPFTWTEYAVWSKISKKEIYNYSINKPKIFVENFIPFRQLSFIKKTFPKNSIAVFDLEPHDIISIITESAFQTHYEYIYYNQLIYKKFFIDIINVAKANNFKIFHKKKRFLYNDTISYKIFIQGLERSEYFQSVDPNYDPLELIKNTSGIISQAFTSVSYIAKLNGKPSIYYDPFNYILKDDNHRNGVQIKSGRKELSKWFKKI